jgi:SanA protein
LKTAYHASIYIKKITKICLLIGVGVLSFALFCNLWVIYSSKSANYFSVKKIPSNNVGLVLGTSKYISGGNENLFFKYRVEAAARLYREGKIKHLILSGNNDSEYYNEPQDMKNALIALGVPADAMTLDYVGKRTYDSVLRCKDVFKQDSCTIISQTFHNIRALYLAQQYGIKAVAFAAQDVPTYYSIRTVAREYLARPKAILDVYLFHPPTSKENIEIPSIYEKLLEKRMMKDSLSDSLSVSLPLPLQSNQ